MAIQGVRLSFEDFIRFNQELEALARTRLPLSTGISRLGKELKSSRGLQTVAQDIAHALEGGRSLSQALDQSGHRFPRLYLEMIRVGERSESLAPVLSTVVRAGHREQEMRSALRTLLVYPAFILAIALFVTFMLAQYVLPYFREMYAELGAELPGLTRMLLTVLGYFSGWGLAFLFLAPVLAMILLRGLYGLNPVRKFLDAAIYRTPLIGPMMSVHHTGQWCRALGELLGGGVPLDESLDYASEAMPNRTLRKISQAAAAHVRRGGRMVESLEGMPAIPSSYRWMLGRAEERGDLGETCRELAELSDANTSYFRQRAFLFFEPIVLIFIGVAVGFLVVSLYLPLFSLGHVIGLV